MKNESNKNTWSKEVFHAFNSMLTLHCSHKEKSHILSSIHVLAIGVVFLPDEGCHQNGGSDSQSKVNLRTFASFFFVMGVYFIQGRPEAHNVLQIVVVTIRMYWFSVPL